MIDLTNEEGLKGWRYFVETNTASSAPQTYRATFHDLDPEGETLTLAFPPGDGIVVVLSASLMQ